MKWRGDAAPDWTAATAAAAAATEPYAPLPYTDEWYEGEALTVPGAEKALPGNGAGGGTCIAADVGIGP